MSSHLVLRDLAVSFNGFMAVNGLDLTISKGELRCLIGPNGAGKTTCLDLICGKVKPTAGSILFNGKHLEILEEYTIARSGVALDEAFVPALAPGWLDHFIYNEDFGTDEEFVYALADAMRDKYRAIVEAGFILQIDDPGIATSWDMLKPEPSLTDYRKYVLLRIEALNHALAGIQPEKVRYHWCWGSWHGAHVNDIPLEHIIDIALKVKAQTYSFEAANVRHQHEMEVWKETKLTPGTILMPGVISHATNIVEHPELIARRLVDWAGIVGRENVVGGADCGMGGRVHAEIGWTKLAALAEGAALATKTLWH